MYRGQPTVKQLQALAQYANAAVVPRLSLSPHATSRTPHWPVILIPCTLGLHSHPHPPASSCKRCWCPALPRTPYWSGTYPALLRSPGCCEECVPSSDTHIQLQPPHPGSLEQGIQTLEIDLIGRGGGLKQNFDFWKFKQQYSQISGG
jgi:hypothetical protein